MDMQYYTGYHKIIGMICNLCVFTLNILKHETPLTN